MIANHGPRADLSFHVHGMVSPRGILCGSRSEGHIPCPVVPTCSPQSMHRRSSSGDPQMNVELKEAVAAEWTAEPARTFEDVPVSSSQAFSTRAVPLSDLGSRTVRSRSTRLRACSTNECR